MESVDKLSIQCRMLSERVAAHFHRHKTNTEFMGAEVPSLPALRTFVTAAVSRRHNKLCGRREGPSTRTPAGC